MSMDDLASLFNIRQDYDNEYSFTSVFVEQLLYFLPVERVVGATSGCGRGSSWPRSLFSKVVLRVGEVRVESSIQLPVVVREAGYRGLFSRLV